MWEAETFHLYTLHNTSVASRTETQCVIEFVQMNEFVKDIIPARDIPNLAAVLGKSPRSMVPKDKRLFEYLKEWKMSECVS